MKDKPECFICGKTRSVRIHFVDWNRIHDVPHNKIFACQKCIDLMAAKDVIDIFGLRKLRKSFNSKRSKPVQLELFK